MNIDNSDIKLNGFNLENLNFDIEDQNGNQNLKPAKRRQFVKRSNTGLRNWTAS